MKYYVAMVIRHGATWYLTKHKPGNNFMNGKQEWYGNLGPQLANRFKTKEDAMQAIASYSAGKDVEMGSVAEVVCFKIMGAKRS